VSCLLTSAHSSIAFAFSSFYRRQGRNLGIWKLSPTWMKIMRIFNQLRHHLNLALLLHSYCILVEVLFKWMVLICLFRIYWPKFGNWAPVIRGFELCKSFRILKSCSGASCFAAGTHFIRLRCCFDSTGFVILIVKYFRFYHLF